MIDKKEVKHIATLARIGVTEEEIGKYSQELSGILDWMEKLKEVKTNNVEPTDHIAGMINIFREDREEDFKSKKELADSFPEQKDGYDKVKSVL